MVRPSPALQPLRPARAQALAPALAAAIALAGHMPAWAATYHVDFANGSDTADGLSPATAWQRAPGDSRAGAGPRAVRLQPGDTILFRGGVAYRGTITVRTAGTPDAPIRYVGNGWGPAPAILDGAEPAADARPCRSARDCGGNPGWADLHHVSLGSDSFAWDGLFQQDRAVSLSPTGLPLSPGSATPKPGAGGRILLVRPHTGMAAAFARGAGRVGFLLVAGGHVEIRGFRPARFAHAPRFGPYAGRPLVQLQPLAGVTLAELPPDIALHRAAPVGPVIAGVTSGPI
jgi:hypothetical protein